METSQTHRRGRSASVARQLWLGAAAAKRSSGLVSSLWNFKVSHHYPSHPSLWRCEALSAFTRAELVTDGPLAALIVIPQDPRKHTFNQSTNPGCKGWVWVSQEVVVFFTFIPNEPRKRAVADGFSPPPIFSRNVISHLSPFAWRNVKHSEV